MENFTSPFLGTEGRTATSANHLANLEALDYLNAVVKAEEDLKIAEEEFAPINLKEDLILELEEVENKEVEDIDFYNAVSATTQGQKQRETRDRYIKKYIL